PSPQQDISRTHVEIKPEGDHVVVTDLRSTNGTIVTLPGAEARRLHPGEAIPVGAGAVIDLGDGVTADVQIPDPAEQPQPAAAPDPAPATPSPHPGAYPQGYPPAPPSQPDPYGQPSGQPDPHGPAG